MWFDSHSEHSGVGFAEISKTFVTQDPFYLGAEPMDGLYQSILCRTTYSGSGEHRQVPATTARWNLAVATRTKLLLFLTFTDVFDGELNEWSGELEHLVDGVADKVRHDVTETGADRLDRQTAGEDDVERERVEEHVRGHRHSTGLLLIAFLLLLEA